MNYKSIRVRLVATFVVISVLLSVILITIVPSKAATATSQSVETSWNFLSDLVSNSLQTGLQTRILDEGQGLKDALALLKVGQPGGMISSMDIFDETGAVILGKEKASIKVEAFAKETSIVTHTDSTMRVKMKILSPEKEVLGFTDLVYTKADLNSKNSAFLAFMWTLVFILLALVIAAAFLLAASITKPVNHSINLLRDIAEGEGDLTKTLPTQMGGEIGKQAEWFNVFVGKLRGLIGETATQSNKIESATGSILDQISINSNLSGELQLKSNDASARMDDALDNLGQMGRDTAQVNHTIESLSNALSNMKESINQISNNCDRESAIANQANVKAQSTIQEMQTLSESAKEIDKIVDVINSISNRTNLLALNATIEAASAGDAGKGFAVVAQEVKQLSQQTKNSVDEISLQTETMRNRMENAMGSVGSIAEVIETVTEIASEIAHSLEIQRSVVTDLTSQIQGAFTAISEINSKVEVSNSEITEAVSAVKNVDRISTEMASSLAKTNANANDMAVVVKSLTDIVNQFKY